MARSRISTEEMRGWVKTYVQEAGGEMTHDQLMDRLEADGRGAAALAVVKALPGSEVFTEVRAVGGGEKAVLVYRVAE